jgi:putative transcriptional regulator
MKGHESLREAIRETGDDMLRLGLLDEATHARITLRDWPGSMRDEPPALAPEEIRAIRDNARMSQAVFARCLNLTAGYVSQLERGVKRPTGPALVLLDLMRRKGVEALL